MKKKINLSLSDKVAIDISYEIEKKLYSGNIRLDAIKKNESYIFSVDSVFNGIKFLKLHIDKDLNSKAIRFRIFHDWIGDFNKESTKPLKTILLSCDFFSDYLKSDEIKYIVEYFSKASRDHYSFYKEELTKIHNGKFGIIKYIKQWLNWNRKVKKRKSQKN